MSASTITHGTFGELSVPSSQGGIATYRAFATPAMNEGVTLLTYMLDIRCEAIELPPTNIKSPEVRVDEVGHVTIVNRALGYESH